jgi:cellulose synthase/poly-beta-1,6-N-acetylglucosamine synthase-like glycosyltransferase
MPSISPILRAMEALFFILIFLSAYPFVVYPAVLLLISGIVRRPWEEGEIRPAVTIVVSAHNEEAVIAQKVRNCLDLDYPEGAIDIIVVSDGSTDRTDEIVSSIKDHRVSLAVFPRLGKTACLNRVVPSARGEICVFTDANSMFPPHALATVVGSLKDPTVGAVTGWTEYVNPENGRAVTGLYSGFERWMKHRESLAGSCVGADGAIFAVRKSLFRALREDDINDLVIPLNVLKAGKRVVMNPGFFCYEQSAQGAYGEYRRQVRITARTLTALRRNMGCMNPFRFGLFSFFLISHKGMRLTFPFFMLGATAACALLYEGPGFFKVFLWSQALAVVVAAYGLLRKTQNRFIGIAAIFLLTAFAHLAGWLRMIRGASDVIWLPRH